MQNLELLQVLVERTSHKAIVECANDRLWGTGIPLAREGCLSQEKWISPGILGELLMENHDNPTVFPIVEQVKPQSQVQQDTPTLPGVTNPPLLGVTPMLQLIKQCCLYRHHLLPHPHHLKMILRKKILTSLLLQSVITKCLE